MREITKLGHQAPKGWRVNRFNSIEIKGDFAYCKSHNFIYNTDVEDFKLYMGLPCHHTDVRFVDTFHNYYKECKIYWTRWKDISLKSCIHKTLECRNIPVGTIVRFGKSWYHPGKKIDNGYAFKIKKENIFLPNYEINDPAFFDNFKTCERSKKLVNLLRENGFLVRVQNKNVNFISNMISSATLYGKGEYNEPEFEEGEMAIAYGYGKKVGFSSSNNTFMGYNNGCDSILWDRFGEFDKWSRCLEIPKSNDIKSIVRTLKEPNEKLNEK